MQHTRPERSYSMLSRSAQRGPDSLTDSGKEEQPTTNTHTTLTNKSSLDSYVVSGCGGSGAVSFTKRFPTSQFHSNLCVFLLKLYFQTENDNNNDCTAYNNNNIIIIITTATIISNNIFKCKCTTTTKKIQQVPTNIPMYCKTYIRRT